MVYYMKYVLTNKSWGTPYHIFSSTNSIFEDCIDSAADIVNSFSNSISKYFNAFPSWLSFDGSCTRALSAFSYKDCILTISTLCSNQSKKGSKIDFFKFFFHIRNLLQKLHKPTKFWKIWILWTNLWTNLAHMDDML